MSDTANIRRRQRSLLFATLTARTHRMAISRQRGKENGRKRRKPCRVDGYNAWNGDFVSTRQRWRHLALRGSVATARRCGGLHKMALLAAAVTNHKCHNHQPFLSIIPFLVWACPYPGGASKLSFPENFISFSETTHGRGDNYAR